MKFTVFAAALSLASAVAASPLRCLSTAQANQLITRFTGILDKQGSDLGDANATAQAIIATNYQEISDSINSLAGNPLGSVTFNGKTAYLDAVLNAPPVGGVENINIFVAGCNHLVWTWNFASVGTAQYPVKGTSLFTVNAQKQLTQHQLEFNSVAWGQDTYQLPCGTSSASSSESSGEPQSGTSSGSSSPAEPAPSPSGSPTS